MMSNFGQIDYSITDKLPQELRKLIASKQKKLVLINPPYAEAMNAGTGVASTKVGSTLMGDLGYASRELYVQFLMRIAKEMPDAVVAMFSTLKYVSAPNFNVFREAWPAKYLGGFIIHSRAFDGLKGDFPIGFLVWDTAKSAHKKKPMTDIVTTVLEKDTGPIGKRLFQSSRIPGFSTIGYSERDRTVLRHCRWWGHLHLSRRKRMYEEPNGLLAQSVE